MDTHISEELPRLLTGEASRDVVMAAAAHLRHCHDCQQELVSAVVAHASLTSAHRFAPEIVAAIDSLPSTEKHEPLALADLPDLSAVFTQIRQATSAASNRNQTRIGSHRGRYLVAAAAVVALAGAGVGTYALTANGNRHNAAAVQTVRLAAYGTGSVPATAELASTGTMTINANKLVHLTDKRYEVWLTNATRTQMQPVGWIGADGKASLTVPPDLVSHYSAIEVSVQPLDSGSYTYSNVSVLRGSYSS